METKFEMYFEKLLKIYFKFQNFESFAKFKNIIKTVCNYQGTQYSE